MNLSEDSRDQSGSEGIDPSWDHDTGKTPWEEVVGSVEDTVNRLLDEADEKSAKQQIAELVRSPGFKDFVTSPRKYSPATYVPIAVLPSKFASGWSRVLLFKKKIAFKQIRSRTRKERPSRKIPFDWTHYQRLQEMLDNLLVEPWVVGSRYTGLAKSGGIYYRFAWELEEGNRNVLVTLYPISEKKAKAILALDERKR